MQKIIVKIPEKCVLFGGTKDGKYVYYTVKSAYNPKTQNNKNDRVIIGKEIKDKPGYMQVNKNYFNKEFPIADTICLKFAPILQYI